MGEGSTWRFGTSTVSVGQYLTDRTQCNFADKNTNFKWSNMDVDDGYQLTAPVGSYLANGYGLYDMAGNVWKWCLDAYHNQFYNNLPSRNPIRGTKSIADVVENHINIDTERAMRGGAWNDDAKFLQVTSRDNYPPLNTESSLGFRCGERCNLLSIYFFNFYLFYQQLILKTYTELHD